MERVDGEPRAVPSCNRFTRPAHRVLCPARHRAGAWRRRRQAPRSAHGQGVTHGHVDCPSGLCAGFPLCMALAELWPPEAARCQGLARTRDWLYGWPLSQVRRAHPPCSPATRDPRGETAEARLASGRRCRVGDHRGIGPRCPAHLGRAASRISTTPNRSAASARGSTAQGDAASSLSLEEGRAASAGHSPWIARVIGPRIARASYPSRGVDAPDGTGPLSVPLRRVSETSQASSILKATALGRCLPRWRARRRGPSASRRSPWMPASAPAGASIRVPGWTAEARRARRRALPLGPS
jgi:hypothetical protein